MELFGVTNEDLSPSNIVSSTGAQLANLTIHSDLTDAQSINCQETVTKKKKKKVKGVKGKTNKSSKKKEKNLKVINKYFLKSEEVDPSDSSTIRFQRYRMDDFRLVTLLGTGGFGMVYLAKLAKHKAYFAIKFMHKRQVLDTNDYDSVLMEKKVMLYGNSNAFICRLFCSFQTVVSNIDVPLPTLVTSIPKGYLCFAMEFCCGGDLKFHLDKEKRFPVAKVLFYLTEIVCAIKYLHKLGIIYRDLKLDNVMISESGHIKLVDFGMCLGKIYRQEMLPTDFCGTIEYMAPEVIKANRYNQSVDFWALGIVAYELAVGGCPFTGTDEDELCWCICNLNVTFPCFVPKPLQNLISQLLVKNADERLGMPNSPHGKVTEHAFFIQIDWSQAEKCILTPPYIPSPNSALDTSQFESVFTFADKDVCLTESDMADCMLDKHFPEFEYTNPNLTN